ARKVDAATARAVASCDKERLGFLLDPASCSYDPGHDAGALCTGVAGRGVTGSGSDPAACMSLKEADALMKIWNGPVGTDGKQLWWSLPRGSAYGGQITQANTDFLALALGDVSYSADAASAAGVPAVNTSTLRRNRWTEVSYAGYADAFRRMDTLPYLRDYMTDNADLRKLRDQGGKMILWNGLAEDVIPPTGALYYYEAVVARMGGVDEVQKFFRMYNIPGTAHSSQGRAYTVAGNNGTVPLPMLPGNANQNPAPQQDQMFSTLVEWVERGTAPGEVVITSRDGGTSYPICVHPKKITWIGSGSAKAAANYRCA
ncbi:MAG: Feruloyl esterase, partial [Ramlibacter sp.]|nr:Feruloyl esterase [Ramlibacter sp.]